MSKSSKDDRKQQFIKRRKALIDLSKVVRPLVDEGEFETINEAIKEQYIEQNPDIKEFKTFGQWKAEGATILKGSKSFTVWGQPRKYEQVPEGSEEPEEFKFWPVCYLFADTQVHFKELEETNHEETEPHREPAEAINGDDL